MTLIFLKQGIFLVKILSSQQKATETHIKREVGKVNSNVNGGLWLIMTCQWRFISSNKCPTLMRDVDNGGGCACVKAEDI